MPPTDPAAPAHRAAAGVALVVLLITWARLPAFLALAVAALCVGLAARMPLTEIPRAFQAGVGDTLGFVAMVIALGTVIGKLLAESGGAVVVSNALARALGERRLDWALMLSGFIIGLPVFFQVGLVLLAPVLFTAQRQTSTPLLRLGLPLVAGLSAAHGLVPPHPGPLAAIERLGADPGRTLFYSLIVGLPVAILAGPLYAALYLPPRARRAGRDRGAVHQRRAAERGRRRSPSRVVTMLHAGAADAAGAALAQIAMAEHARRADLVFTGSPLVAMLVATLVAMFTSAARADSTASGCCSSPRNRCRRLPACCSWSAPAAVSGACSTSRHVDTAIAQAMGGLRLSPLVMGWVIASLLRLSVGSATVSVITAASIMAPLVCGMPGVNKELLVVSIGAGSLIASHVNDGGFWLVKEYLNMSVPQTFATWTIIETIVSVLRLAGVLLLAIGGVSGATQTCSAAFAVKAKEKERKGSKKSNLFFLPFLLFSCVIFTVAVVELMNPC